MKWFNYWGIIILFFIMIPNIIYAIKHKESFENSYNNKKILAIEQISRYGSMIFMLLNIPYLSKGFWFSNSMFIYLFINGIFLAYYCACWLIFWNKNSMFKVLSLSITPSLIFLFSGIILLNIPLIVVAILFSVAHITVSIKNYKLKEQ